MRNVLILMCGMVMLSSVAFADDTTTIETCADGAGIVIEGAVTGYKYCKSNTKMNWWNAYAWCDALEMRLFDLSDCACSDTISDCSRCVELKDLSVGGIGWIWTNTSSTINPKETNAHEKMVIIMSNSGQWENGHFNYNGPRQYSGATPLCK